MNQLPTTMRCPYEAQGVGGIRTMMTILAGCALLLGLVTDAAAMRSQSRYCVAQRDASEDSVKAAILWACTNGQVQHSACSNEFKCITTYERADIIFNIYYKRYRQTQQDEACDFRGAAQLSTGELTNRILKYEKATLKPFVGVCSQK